MVQSARCTRRRAPTVTGNQTQGPYSLLHTHTHTHTHKIHFKKLWGWGTVLRVQFGFAKRYFRLPDRRTKE
jgi:hypothetical protein